MRVANLILWTLLTSSAVVAATIDVPKAAPTIQAGIDMSVDGDEVVVADGVYTGAGNRDIDFGGRAITLRSAGGDPVGCTIDCSGAGRGLFFGSGEPATAIIRGFTVTGGNAATGGAIRIEGASNPTIESCIFEGNTADIGAGIYVTGSAPTINECMFVGNIAATGGAVRSTGASPRFLNCLFADNLATAGSGGALRIEGGAPNAIGCRFVNNTAAIGGAVRSTFASPTLIGCSFFGNNATGGAGGAIRIDGGTALVIDGFFSGNFGGLGGALYITVNGQAHVVSCTIAGNDAITGSAFYALSGSMITVGNCLIWANTDEQGSPIDGSGTTIVDYSVVEGGHDGVSNLDIDPLLSDLDGLDDALGTLDDDPRLAAGSPARDAGHSWLIGVDIFDQDADGDSTEILPLDVLGQPRFSDDPTVADTGCGAAAVIDIGGWEAPGAPLESLPAGDLDGSLTVGINDLLVLLAAWGPCQPASCCLGDLDVDGVVGIEDLLAILSSWSS